MNSQNVAEKSNAAACTDQPSCQNGNKEAVQTRFVRPRYRVRENEADFNVTVELPGVSKAALEVSLVDGLLEVEGSRDWAERSDWTPLAGVVEDGVSYRLKLAVGDDVDGDRITAELDNGILQLTLAKAEEKKPRRIAVN